MATYSFRYGTMNSSKSANLLMTAHNYESQGRRILCIKPSVDTRILNDELKGKGVIESRAVPESHPCELIDKDIDLFKYIKEYNNEIVMKYVKGLSAVLVDEAQFLAPQQAKQLAEVVDKLNIDVICFGLKNSYVDGKIFDGASAVLYYANSIYEIETPCKYCDSKATMNLRIVNGRAVYSGDTLAIGDVDDSKEVSEVYAQVCYHHYINPPAPINGKENSKTLTIKSFNESLLHVLNYKNANGFYKQTSDVKKEKLAYSIIFDGKNKNDLAKVRYIAIGPISISLEEYCKNRENSPINRVNGTAITKAIIDFVYDFFDGDYNSAFRLLQDADSRQVKFYKNEEVMKYDCERRNFTEETIKKCIHNLPDGRFFYLDTHTVTFKDFWERIMNGIHLFMNGVSVGFYYMEDSHDSEK